QLRRPVRRAASRIGRDARTGNTGALRTRLDSMQTSLVTRREVLGALAAGTFLGNRAVLARASQPRTPVDFDIPANACDCHTHIVGDPRKYPFWAGRAYTPETALPAEMAAMHRVLHMKRVVIVTPSIYGTDNSATLYGMKAREGDARGVA